VTTGCNCGCGDTSGHAVSGGCTCGCSATAPQTTMEEIAQLKAQREQIDRRLGELAAL
jgi:hypothetical protein